MSRQHFKIGKGISLTPVASRPTDPENGDVIYNSTTNLVERYERVDRSGAVNDQRCKKLGLNRKTDF